MQKLNSKRRRSKQLQVRCSFCSILWRKLQSSQRVDLCISCELSLGLCCTIPLSQRGKAAHLNARSDTNEGRRCRCTGMPTGCRKAIDELPRSR